MRKSKIPHLALLAFLCTAQLAQAAPDKLAYIYRNGEERRYELFISAESTDKRLPCKLDVRVNGTLRQKAVTSTKNGAAKIISTTESSRVVMPSMSTTTTSNRKRSITMRVAANGRPAILSSEGGLIAEMITATDGIMGGGGLITPILPDAPLSPHKKLTKRFTAYSQPITITYELAGPAEPYRIRTLIAGKLPADQFSSGSDNLGNMNLTGDPISISGSYDLIFSGRQGKLLTAGGKIKMRVPVRSRQQGKREATCLLPVDVTVSIASK